MNAQAALWNDLPRYLAAHVELSLVALVAGFAISLPLGVLASRRPGLGRGVLAIASVLQTIPGLALLALMVPLLGALGAFSEARGGPALSSIGFLPAVLALTLYSVLPMLRNVVTGLQGVDPAILEASRGVGMSPGEVLRQVELPLALPTIVAGVRTATVWVVGMATLATPVGGTSLGNPIFAGLQTRNLSAVLAGSAAAALLAIALDGLVRLAEVGFERRSRGRIGLAGLGLLLIVGAAVGAGLQTGPGRSIDGEGPAVEVRVGAKSFTEQYVLAKILGASLESAGAGHVRELSSLGSTVAFDALVAGDLDVYVDYSGTIWATILGQTETGVGRAAVLAEVEARLLAEHGVVVLAALGFENTYCLAMRGEDARKGGLRRIGDLTAIAPQLEIFGDFEFFERPEWRALRATYALAFGTERAMDASLMYEALGAGNGDVISAYSTDGRIAAQGLVVLEDDRQVIPPYDAIVLARADFEAEHPALAQALRALHGRIDAAGMRALNARVDLAGESPAAAAAAWWAHCDPGRSTAPGACVPAP